MPLEPFDVICHDVALAELRACHVPEPSASGPGDKYFLREFYCTERRCDCRRVLVQFIRDGQPSGVAASINYGWERAGFYARWSRDTVMAREMASATLEPFAEQGPHAQRFLRIFNHLIEDPQLVEAFRRHYRLVKEIVDKR
jgi:hypothetical protein